MTLPPAYTDEQLVAAAAEAARTVSAGGTVPESTITLLRAIASTKAEAKRHELARQARAQAGQLSALALDVLRVIFVILL